MSPAFSTPLRSDFIRPFPERQELALSAVPNTSTRARVHQALQQIATIFFDCLESHVEHLDGAQDHGEHSSSCCCRCARTSELAASVAILIPFLVEVSHG